MTDQADKCPRCELCKGNTHHWLTDPQPEYPDGTNYACKHCSARGRACSVCNGEGCEACQGEGVVHDLEASALAVEVERLTTICMAAGFVGKGTTIVGDKYLAKLNRQIADVEADNARLRGLLKPFADIWHDIEHADDDWQDDDTVSCPIAIEHFREAAEAAKEGKR